MRIIPARAGFTGRRPRSGGARRDHPRSRGVYMAPHARDEQSAGLSPLARGLLHRSGLAPTKPGIIPARAGFTRSHAAWEAARRDHPRSRGVYQRAAVGPPLVWGSSPLARGLLERRATSAPQLRIIPARAGFTRWAKSCLITIRDHPRSRGVYGDEEGAGCRVRGSSPLARGLHVAAREFNIGAGIIPARAGFTAMSRRASSLGRDHPRSRGVYSTMPTDLKVSAGSSPLARGLRWRKPEDPGDRRIIPARAGFTRREQRQRAG